jgi:hypothetical protein
MQVGSKAALEAFLAQYPDGFYASLARSELDKIAATAPVAPARPQPPAQVQAAKSPDKPADAASAAPAVPAAADKSVNVAALYAGSPPLDHLTRSLQAELRRVGCLTTEADGNWNTVSRRSLLQFNRYAGTKFDTKAASADALDAIKQRSSRVCPLVCEHGYKADGGKCTKIVCAEGSFLNADNQCEKRRGKTPVAKRGPDETPTRQHVLGSLSPAVAVHYCLQGRSWGYPGNCQFSTYEQCKATASGTDSYCGVDPHDAFARQRPSRQ